ncbi:PIN domain-containing protein [Bacillus sp. B15-48]|nr:PIN domain-containing protein [Bacillus sp. B15-48]
MKLVNLVDQRELAKFRQSREVFIPVKELIKRYKESYQDRGSLSIYYDYVLQIFNNLFSSLDEFFGIRAKHVSSDEETFYKAQEFMQEFQLEVKDALHLSVAKQHGANYFATLDSDFAHKFYSQENLENTSILHISKRFIV